MVEKAPQRQQLPSGKIIDHCSECDKYGVIWSGSQSQGQFCRDCDGKKKAAQAGIDAMREGEN